MAWDPFQVAYGVRHKKLFGVLRRGGDAIDAVLALQGTGNVPRGSLRKIGWPDPVTARVFDADERYALTIAADGIVLSVDIEDLQFTHINVRDMFLDLVTVALPLTNPSRIINRLGIVESYVFPHEHPGELASDALSRVDGVGRPTDFAFRSAFRTELPGAEPGGDWLNTIIQVGTEKSDDVLDLPDSLRVSIDHQLHLSPDRMFTPRMVRDHYVRFFDEAERLQNGVLSALGPVVAAVDA